MIAVSAFVEQKKRFLVCKRPSGMKMAGFWEHPTGVLDENETLEDCLERTCFETLSRKLSEFSLEKVFDAPEDPECRMFVYRVKLRNHFIHLEHYSQFKWLNFKELERFQLMKSSVMYIK